MKNKYLIITAILFLCLASCSDKNLEIQKRRQGESSRNVGEAYMGEGNYTLALKEFLKAQELYPDDPILQNDLGLAYMGKEKLEIALEHFKKAIQLAPDYAPAKNNLGTAYLAKKDWDAAITAFKEVTEDILYATPHFPFSNLGLAYYSKGDYENAEKYYLEAVKLQPDFVIALRGLGRTYLATEKSSKAVQYLEKSVESSFSGAKINPELYFDLAKAYVLSKNNKKAVDAYKKAIALSPDTPLAKEAEKAVKQIK